jgi:3-oxoacyl-[acyl-carrier-protein] synthase II
VSRKRVVVTGIGAVTPHGDNPQHFFDVLLRGESAIRLFKPEDAPHPVVIPAGYCASFNGIASLGRSLANGMDRFSQLGAVAARSAWQNSGLDQAASLPKNDIGVFWGTGGGGLSTTERSYRDLYLRDKARISPLSVVLGMSNAAASHIALGMGLGGANFTYSVACASSAIAIGEAFRRVRSGETPVMLAGGSETPLVYGVIRAWESLQVLALGDDETAPKVCRPFDVDRHGLVMSEGAGAIVLEDREHAIDRGAHIYAELSGYGTSCDHSHLSRPDPAGQIRALSAALADADMRADEIDYVNAHGTATREGDAAEIAALTHILAGHSSQVAISATKSMHGHAMGAAGVIEAIVTIMALAQQAIPPTAHLETIAPECAGLRHVVRGEVDVDVRAALSNSFAFGGSNAVLAFRKHNA